MKIDALADFVSPAHSPSMCATWMGNARGVRSMKATKTWREMLNESLEDPHSRKEWEQPSLLWQGWKAI